MRREPPTEEPARSKTRARAGASGPALMILMRLFVPVGCLGVPYTFAETMWTASKGVDFDWVTNLLITHIGLMLFFFVAPWSWLTYWLRYAAVFGLLASALHSGRMHGLLLSTSLLGLVFVAVSFYMKRCPRASKPVELTFPLRGGVFYIAQGGATYLLNLHRRSRSQRYALDILQVNRFGARARGLYPPDRTRFYVYGALIVSPCNGTVTHVVDGMPDLVPPQRDPSNPAGNHVVIRDEKTRVVVGLAHLQPGSLLVKEGDTVQAGQPVARVGNSGNTTEPHLHIHAKRGGCDDSMLDGEGVPMLFNERFLVRNDLVRSREVTTA